MKTDKPQSTSTKSAWVQLYEARRVMPEVQTRPPGRPSALIPRKKVGMTLSKGEVQELEVWRDRFSELLNRKVSTGETVGILARISSTRYNRLKSRLRKVDELPLDELVELLIGEMK
ncbi:MAG: hypothetical protein JEZ06_20840 [Anaerolineaceae bacterium]|nr:hypothetical protein [Anaerolineaceae bacterium]